MPNPPNPATRVGVILAAAGESRRMGGIDKVMAPLLGKPLFTYSVDIFQASPLIATMVLVLREDLLGPATQLKRDQGWSKLSAIVPGGRRRQDSVAAGLAALGPCDWIMVHDGARPCLDLALLERGLAAAQATGAAIAAVPAKDTIKSVDAQSIVTGTPKREHLWQVQTPQVFRADLLRSAYAAATADVTDDAALVEQLGGKVKVFMGSYENIKVTTPEDLQVAELFLRIRKAALA